MKASRIVILVVFMLGWLAGSLFVFFLLTYDERTYSTLKSGFGWSLSDKQNKRHNLRSIGSVVASDLMKTIEVISHISILSNNYSEVLSQTLPSFDGETLSVDDEVDAPLVFMDWPMDEYFFTKYNYRSLESFLSVYPSARYTCILPLGSRKRSRNFGNHLSPRQFEKYSRMGYDIRVQSADGDGVTIAHKIGKKYWSKWLIESANSRELTPYHVLTFIRLSNLWRKGGIFTDFSMLLLGPLSAPHINQGYIMETICNNDRSALFPMGRTHSSLLSFHSVLNASGIRSSSCFTTTVFSFMQPKSAAISCVLSKYDDLAFLSCVEGTRSRDDGGASCIRDAIDACFDQENLYNDLDLYQHSDLARRRVEMFGRDENAATKILSSKNWTIGPKTRLVWLGSLTWTPSWSLGSQSETSLLQTIVRSFKLKPVAAGSLLLANASSADGDDTDDDLPSLTVVADKESQQPPRWSQFSAELTNKAFQGIQGDPSHQPVDPTALITHVEDHMHSPNFVITGSTEFDISVLENLLQLHPLLLPRLKSSASSNDSRRSRRHQDGSCYHPDPRNNLIFRSTCFPYVEPTEVWMTFDASLEYNSARSVPLRLFLDNPSMKLIYLLRHPVDRLLFDLISILGTDEHTLGNRNLDDSFFESLVESGIMENQKFGLLRHLLYTANFTDAVSPTEDGSERVATQSPGKQDAEVISSEAFINFYYGGHYRTLFNASGVPASADRSQFDGLIEELFLHSLTFPSLLQYKRVLGPERVLVVNAELLSPLQKRLLDHKQHRQLGGRDCSIPSQVTESIDGFLQPVFKFLEIKAASVSIDDLCSMMVDDLLVRTASRFSEKKKNEPLKQKRRNLRRLLDLPSNHTFTLDSDPQPNQTRVGLLPNSSAAFSSATSLNNATLSPSSSAGTGAERKKHATPPPEKDVVSLLVHTQKSGSDSILTLQPQPAMSSMNRTATVSPAEPRVSNSSLSYQQLNFDDHQFARLNRFFSPFLRRALELTDVSYLLRNGKEEGAPDFSPSRLFADWVKRSSPTFFHPFDDMCAPKPSDCIASIWIPRRRRHGTASSTCLCFHFQRSNANTNLDWFDIEDSLTDHSSTNTRPPSKFRSILSLVSKLLSSEENENHADTSYNTTLGMLISF